jgi:hypothetical protein
VGAASLGTAAFMPDRLSVAVGETATWLRTPTPWPTSASDAAGGTRESSRRAGTSRRHFKRREHFLTTAPFTRAWWARSLFTDVHGGVDRHHS